jgi:hypothetical protein
MHAQASVRHEQKDLTPRHSQPETYLFSVRPGPPAAHLPG